MGQLSKNNMILQKESEDCWSVDYKLSLACASNKNKKTNKQETKEKKDKQIEAIIVQYSYKLSCSVYFIKVHSTYRCKEIESLCDSMSPPQYKLVGCHGINSMTLVRVDDMYIVSPLSWIGTPDISTLEHYNIWHQYMHTN